MPKDQGNAITVGFIGSILLLDLGGIGGSFQVSRLLILALFPFACVKYFANYPRSEIRRVLNCIGTMLILGIISIFWSYDQWAGLLLLSAVGVGMAALVYAGALPRSIGTVKLVCNAWTVALIATLPIALYEFSTGNHFSFALDSRNAGGAIGDLPYASILFGNYNNYGAFICLCFPFLLSRALDQRFGILKGILWICVFVCVLIVTVNTTRTAIVCLLIMICGVFAFERASRLYIVSAASFSGFFAFVYYASQAQTAIEFALFRFQGLGAGDESSDQRLGIIEAGVGAILSNSGLGVGAGGFESYMNIYYPSLIPNPHNMLLEIALNFTIISCIIFVYVIFYLFFKLARTSHMHRFIKTPFLFALPLVPVIGVISSQAISYTYWWIWLTSVVFIVATLSEQSSNVLPRSVTTG